MQRWPVSKAPTNTVASKDQPGEKSPKEASLDPHSGEDSLRGQKIDCTLDCWDIVDNSTLRGKLDWPGRSKDGCFVFMHLLIPLTSSTPLYSGDVVTVKGRLVNYSCLLGKHEKECRLRKNLGGLLPPMTDGERAFYKSCKDY